ncbi:hypothetical protein FKM82_030594 [Ascaphus truei]
MWLLGGDTDVSKSPISSHSSKLIAELSEELKSAFLGRGSCCLQLLPVTGTLPCRHSWGNSVCGGSDGFIQTGRKNPLILPCSLALGNVGSRFLGRSSCVTSTLFRVKGCFT